MAKHHHSTTSTSLAQHQQRENSQSFKNLSIPPACCACELRSFSSKNGVFSLSSSQHSQRACRDTGTRHLLHHSRFTAALLPAACTPLCSTLHFFLFSSHGKSPSPTFAQRLIMCTGKAWGRNGAAICFKWQQKTL